MEDRILKSIEKREGNILIDNILSNNKMNTINGGACKLFDPCYPLIVVPPCNLGGPCDSLFTPTCTLLIKPCSFCDALGYPPKPCQLT